VMINKSPCELIAESPRSASLTVPPDIQPGSGNIEIQEGGYHITIPIQVAMINMSTDKAVLKKGQKAKITIQVQGLDRNFLVKNDYKLTLNNLSPGSIAFVKESNPVIVDIDPRTVLNYTYTYTTMITGLTTGKYTLTASLNSGEDQYRNDCIKSYLDALDADMNPKLAQKYLDAVLAAYHPGTAPGSCRAGPSSGGSFTCVAVSCTANCIAFSIPKKGGMDEDPKNEGVDPTPVPGRIYFCSCSKWQWW